MNKLQIFNYQEKEVRTTEINGEPWFVSKDVCNVLEISNCRDALVRINDSMKGVATTDTLGGNQEMSILSEAGVYKLVFTSRKPEAEKFTDWLASEVIPQIRRTGSYSKQMSPAELTAMIAQNQVEIERTANSALKIATKASKQITNALEIFTKATEPSWREDINAKLNAIVQNDGLSYSAFKGELYVELDSMARVNIATRQVNLRKRMKQGGSTYAECHAISKLDIVERDPKLKPIFEGIVRKYQVKYAVA